MEPIYFDHFQCCHLAGSTHLHGQTGASEGAGERTVRQGNYLLPYVWLLHTACKHGVTILTGTIKVIAVDLVPTQLWALRFKLLGPRGEIPGFCLLLFPCHHESRD